MAKSTASVTPARATVHAEPHGHRINGAVRATEGGGPIDVVNPADGGLIGQVWNGTEGDVADAVSAADAAFPAWSESLPQTRANVLWQLAQRIASGLPELAELESRVTGRPIREMKAQMSRIPEWLEFFAAAALTLEAEANRTKGGFLTYTQYEPHGVCALLTPWNHPVLILVKKLAAALAAGNTVVAKPSELAPISPLLIADWAVEAGLPPGVFNVVNGDGTTGAALCAAPEVAHIDLTGGTETGRRVAAMAGSRLVPVVMELGGKAPVLVFADADLEEAVAGALFASFVAAGQTCVSGTRILVEAGVYEPFLERFAERALSLRVGDPADSATDMGPVISASARARCLGHIETAQADGARLLAGGGAPDDLPDALKDGHFVEPTVFADVTAEMRLFREEVFGPVVAVTPFEDEDHALTLANDCDFALGASIWTRDITRAHRLAGRVKAGVVWVNDHHKNDPRSVWGGFGASGWGKENGWDALKGYMRKRSVTVRTAPEFDDWFAGGTRYG